jgi:hypothetical protein
MKTKILFLFVCLLASLASCKKMEDPQLADNSIFNAGGVYSIKSGNVSISTPDTTYVFTAPADQITFSGDSNYFNIVCYRDNSTSFNVSSTEKAVAYATTNIYELHLFGPYKNAPQVYTNVTTSNIGTITLSDLNFGDIAAKGTFKATAGNGSKAPAQVTGTFDLKLNK